jgi:hypothetical protein
LFSVVTLRHRRSTSLPQLDLDHLLFLPLPQGVREWPATTKVLAVGTICRSLLALRVPEILTGRIPEILAGHPGL